MPITFTLTEDTLIAIRNDGLRCRTDLPYYQNWVSNGGVPIPYDDKCAVLNKVRLIREIVIGRLNGISGVNSRAGNTAVATACDTAITSFLAMTSATAVVAATDEASTISACVTEWGNIKTTLLASVPSASTAFDAGGFTMEDVTDWIAILNP